MGQSAKLIAALTVYDVVDVAARRIIATISTRREARRVAAGRPGVRIVPRHLSVGG